MATYTAVDLENAQKFRTPNVLLRKVRKCHTKYPWLISWIDITNEPADYYVPNTLQHAGRKVTLKMTKTLCELISCNAIREKDSCKPDTPATWYRVGDDGFDIQCQPACYNLSHHNNLMYSETNERTTDNMMTNWHDNDCRILDSSMIAWMEKPFYRSKVVYETRVNDMPTGFSRIKSNNPYGGGIEYRTNETYCGYYDRQLDTEDGSCTMTLWEKTLDAVVGMSLINTIKSSIRKLDHSLPFNLPDNLPPIPDKVPSIYTLDGWRSNINANFILPDLIDTKPKKRKRRKKRHVDTHEETLSEFMQLQMGILNQRDYELRRMDNFVKEANKRLNDFNIQQQGQTNELKDVTLKRVRRNIIDVINDNKETFGLKQSIETPNDIDDTSPPPSERQDNKFIRIIKTLLTSLSKAELYEQIGIDVATQTLLKYTQKLCVKIVQKLLSDVFQETSRRIIGSVGEFVLSSAIHSVYTNIAVNSVIRYASQTAIFAAKFTASLTSVIGIILIFTMVLNILFTFWDPYGYNNLFPPTIVSDLMASSELAFRRAFKSPTATYTVDRLLHKLLTENEILEIEVESLFDTVLYLDALVVNSEGSRIHKGESINLHNLNASNIDSGITEAIAQNIVRWDAATYAEYNRRFISRVDANKKLNYIAGGLLVFTGLMFAARLILFALILFILSILVLALAKLCINTDWLIDLYNTAASI